MNKLNTIQLPQTIVSSSIFGNLDKYFEDLQNYEDELYCSNCGNDAKKHLIISELLLMEFIGARCKTENLVREKLMRTTTNITANVLRLCAGGKVNQI
jgi:hypothetical protein